MGRRGRKSEIPARSGTCRTIEAGNIDHETAFRRFCEAGRPLTLFAVFALATLACAVVYDSVPASAAVTRYPHDEPYVCALVAPMIVATFLGRRYLREIVFGELSPARSIAVGLVVPLVTLAVSSMIALPYFTLPHVGIEHALRSPDGPAWLALAAGPFAEEILFQVGAQTKLQRFGGAAAVVGASLPFWAIHIPGGFVRLPDAVFFVLPAVIAYALIRQVTKSLGAATLAHVTYNVLGTMLTHASR